MKTVPIICPRITCRAANEAYRSNCQMCGDKLPKTKSEFLAIPVLAASDIGQIYGYDQVIIVARKVGEGGGEHVTTWGRDKANCSVAARIGDFLKYKVMGWVDGRETLKAIPLLRNVVGCLAWHVEEQGKGVAMDQKHLDDAREFLATITE